MHLNMPFKLLLVAVVFLFTACNHYIATYDQFAYAQTTALKVDVLNLIDKSTGAYTAHQPEIVKVTSDMLKVIEYEKHRPTNGITVKMWNLMIDSTLQKGIIGRYLVSWKNDNTKSETIINEVKQQVSEGFDLIADLESQKMKPSDARVTSFINK